MMQISIIAFLLLPCLILAATTYKQVSWPAAMPKGTGMFTAAAVHLDTGHIYIAQVGGVLLIISMHSREVSTTPTQSLSSPVRDSSSALGATRQ